MKNPFLLKIIQIEHIYCINQSLLPYLWVEIGEDKYCTETERENQFIHDQTHGSIQFRQYYASVQSLTRLKHS